MLTVRPCANHKNKHGVKGEEEMSLRLPVRLAHLTKDQLIELAVALASGEQQVAIADSIIQKHRSFPTWAREAAILAPDLALSLLQALYDVQGPEFIRCARVCKVWASAARATAGRNALIQFESSHGSVTCKRGACDCENDRPNGGLHFSFPTGLSAYPSGGVVVSDYGHHRLQRVSSNGEPAGAFLDTPMCVSTPGAAAFIDEHTAWVVESAPNRLIKVRVVDGFRLVTLNDDDFDQFGMGFIEQVVIKDGSLFVSLAGAGVVAVLDADDGTVIRAIGEKGGHPGELRGPAGIAFHGEFLFVADRANHRVEVFRHADGVHVRSIGRHGKPPEWDEENWQYCPDEDGDSRIGTAAGEFNAPIGVAVAHRCLFVAEGEGRRIQVLSLEGKPLQVVDSPDGTELGDVCADGDCVWACTSPHSSGPNCALHRFRIRLQGANARLMRG